MESDHLSPCISCLHLLTSCITALKSISILQLPSQKSLQAFVGANSDPTGVNEKTAEQRCLYNAMKQQKLKNKMKEPQHEVLIFDEVKVQSKVRLPLACILTQCRLDHFTSGYISVLFLSLSSPNDRWCGILKATTSFVLPLVQMSCVVCNVYELLDADFHTHQTTYVLQFMWRDITSDFEVIGPYFTCEKSLEMKFLAACLFEAMYVFETYNFHIVGLICDGASCNLGLLKRFCDRSGRYGSDINS